MKPVEIEFIMRDKLSPGIDWVVPIATSIVRPAFSQMTGRVSDIFLFINRVKIQLFPNFDKRKLYL